MVEPVLGIVAVTWRRRILVLVGGGCFAGALLLAAGAPSFLVLLLAFSLLYPASGAFVSLSQASLMDLQPERREVNMAHWTLAGAIGAVAGPLLLAGFAWATLGWRGLFAALALVALVLVWRSRAAAVDDGHGERLQVRDALRVLGRRDVFRWLFLLELSDLMLDVFLGFIALYLVDEVGASPAAGGVAVAVWTGAALVGSALSIPMLQRVDGLRYLRISAVLAAGLFVAFLVVPGLAAKLACAAALAVVNAGWYPVLKARLYGALGNASGLMLTVGALFPLNVVLPLALAGLAERWGLDAALWILLAAPMALLVLVPRRLASPNT